MEPKQQREREITYQVGWKRGVISSNKPHAVELEAEIPWVHRFNITFLWGQAAIYPIGVLQVILWIFPILTFACTLWLIHVLSMQSQ
ncbi:hypothetical protein SAMN03159341_104401 [Paenibacillus sp. 1_12]|uniref:hypothetical protein n=1 Tax=Paenibacillus sp. 1_12 TaxID=1566278 RepID=UPI0008E1616A|nr:hypothetical protein [Paenibacillus sp. 1_12]SFL27756.1 hypothetical protein SAMN03159341_104401 [Paenibacillus sp. 1_12]